MLKMVTWQWLVVGAVALACVGFMSWTVARMFSRPSGVLGESRPGTALESGLYGAVASAGSSVYDGFSYRVGARFAGRVRVVVDDGRVVVCGPRIGRGLYAAWIWVQALLLAMVPALLVAAAAKLDWRWLLLGLGVFVLSFGLSSLGAGLWPGLGEVAGLGDGHYPAAEMPLTSVSDVALGRGWANGGLQVVLLPYVGGIDQMAEGHAVSWDGPDGSGHTVRFAVHVYDKSAAEKLAAQLRAGR